MVDIQTLSIVIGAASVVVAMVTFIMNSRKEAKQREDQQIIQRFQSYDIEHARSIMQLMRAADWDTVEDWNKKYGWETNPEWTARFNHIFEFYNLAGISLMRGADPNLIFELYRANSIIILWERFLPITKSYRERTKDPSHRKPFEYLYNEAKKRHQTVQDYYPR